VPHTPFPPGEPASPRDDEPRWFEPVGPAMIEPIVPDEEWSAAADSGRSRDPVAWRDIRWVEFGDAANPTADRIAADPRIAEPLPASAAAMREPPAADTTEETTGETPGSLPRWLGSALLRLFRLGGVAVSLILAAIFLYKGGEMLAGFAGATTPPSATPEPGRPPEAAAVAIAAERLPRPATAATPAAEPVDSRVAEYFGAARAGEPIAQYNLAVLYALGDGIAQDYASAASWFRKAAESGNPAAQFNLAVMYERGFGLPADKEAAFGWYRRAAEHSYPAAEYNLALAYAEGRGTRADPNAAARWYHDAAVQGVVPAMVNVAILYETGDGVGRSLPDAYAWYRAAARRGDTAAGERALELFRTFNGADKAQAVLMAAAVADAMLEPAVMPPPPRPTTAPSSAVQPASAKPVSRKNAGAARRQPAG
jgi:TPR repeat protein